MKYNNRTKSGSLCNLKPRESLDFMWCEKAEGKKGVKGNDKINQNLHLTLQVNKASRVKAVTLSV